MATLYKMTFRVVEEEYNPKRKYVKKVMKGPDLKLFLTADGSITVLEEDIKKYWTYGGGIDQLTYVGELDDKLLAPVISETEFIDEQIKSKKTNEVIGFQG